MSNLMSIGNPYFDIANLSWDNSSGRVLVAKLHLEIERFFVPKCISDPVAGLSEMRKVHHLLFLFFHFYFTSSTHRLHPEAQTIPLPC